MRNNKNVPKQIPRLHNNNVRNNNLLNSYEMCVNNAKKPTEKKKICTLKRIYITIVIKRICSSFSMFSYVAK